MPKPAELYSRQQLLEMPISALAYIGDAVYELAVRSYLLKGCEQMNSGKLFSRSLTYVSATAQAEALRQLWGHLSAEEEQLCKRARNHDAGSRPRHANPVDYRLATALESLIAWLWLQGKEERLTEVLTFVWQFCESFRQEEGSDQ